MKEYDDTIIRGSGVREDQLRLPRAIAIHRSASSHNYAEVSRCLRNNSGDEIIIIKLSRLQIPEYPQYTIHTVEEVAIICRKADDSWPEVYAIRKDFPIGLPHSNAKPFKRPVSMCVVDFLFQDVRLQFSAFNYINLIRDWFEKNSIGELHAQDRQLEILLSTDKMCTVDGESSEFKPDVIFEKVTDRSAILKFPVDKDPKQWLIPLSMETTISQSIAYTPSTLRDLSEIVCAEHNESVFDYLCRLCQKVPSRYSHLPILILLQTKQKRAVGDDMLRLMYILELKISSHDLNHNKERLSKERFKDWLLDSTMDIYGFLDTVCLSQNRRLNGTSVRIPNLVMIGTGTLGANVINHLVRKGACDKISIIDPDIYYPHNYSRHVLPASAMMQKKAQAMHELYKDVHELTITPINKNVLEITKSEQEHLYEKANVIIDSSTVIAVERHLARDINTSTGRCVTMFLSPNGMDLVMLVEDSRRLVRLDMLEMDYYRHIIENAELEDHLALPTEQRINSYSCREKSSVLDFDNIGILSSIASREIQRHYAEEMAVAEIWRINSVSGNVERVDIPLRGWDKYECDGVAVYVSQALEDEMNTERIAWGNLETGGCLCGCYDKDRKIIYVFANIQTPPDSIHNPTSFVRGSKGLNEAIKKISDRAYYQVRYIGEWHSHPYSDSRPSALDREQFAKLDDELLQQDVPFVQMICGTRDFYVKCRM